MKLSEFCKLKNEAKQDSGTIWLANPIADVRMGANQTKSIDITDVFLANPDTTTLNYEFPVSGNNLMVTGNLTLNEQTNRVSLDLVTKAVYGSTFMIIEVSSEFGSVSDTMIVKVDNPDYEWFQWGTNYSFSPENCIGYGETEWKAAVDFDLGQDIYELKEIEFGYGWDGTAQWKITEFSDVPGDSLIWNLDNSFCETDFTGDVSEYIEIPADSSLQMTGNIAVVFTTTANFMAMDPSGDGGHTWIYSEASGWEHPDDIPDYSGAWYIRLLVYKTSTGIEEVITSEKRPVLLQNYPNPFNNQTVISWNLQNSGQIELNIFNSKGQFVKNLTNSELTKGTHSVVFNTDGLDTGIYFYQLKVNGKVENTAKMLYLR